jgi:hypothetical protein
MRCCSAIKYNAVKIVRTPCEEIRLPFIRKFRGDWAMNLGQERLGRPALACLGYHAIKCVDGFPYAIPDLSWSSSIQGDVMASVSLTLPSRQTCCWGPIDEALGGCQPAARSHVEAELLVADHTAHKPAKVPVSMLSTKAHVPANPMLVTLVVPNPTPARLRWQFSNLALRIPRCRPSVR